MYGSSDCDVVISAADLASVPPPIAISFCGGGRGGKVGVLTDGGIDCLLWIETGEGYCCLLLVAVMELLIVDKD